jgi:hypothetical protein
VLEDEHGNPLMAFTTRPTPPLRHHRATQIKGSAVVRGADGVTRVMLDEAPPADAVAVVFYGRDALADPFVPPLGWTRVTDHAAKSIALDARGNCAWTLPDVGHTLAVVYVNATSDYSLPEPLTITRK